MANETEKTKLVVFLDSIGRTILGERATSEVEAGVLSVKNPVVLNVVPDNQGRMSVHLFPIFFREFLADHDEDVVFTFKSEAVTESKIENLDFRLLSQYQQLFGKGNIFIPPAQGIVTPNKGDKVVNLFDGE